jgi:hypothetical protein
VDNKFKIHYIESRLEFRLTTRTDQGNQFTCEEFTKMLRSKDVRVSQDGAGFDDLTPDEVYFGKNGASGVPPIRVACRAGRRSLNGAARGPVGKPSCSSAFIACDILSSQPGPLLWS